MAKILVLSGPKSSGTLLGRVPLNRGKDNNKLLIETSKTGDHGCLIEITAKYRSVFTIIRGSYFQDFGDRL